jgi:predicted nucleotidyltransferase
MPRIPVVESSAISAPSHVGSSYVEPPRPLPAIDLLVDVEPDGGNPLLRVAGIAEELSELLGVRVDVVTETLLREPVTPTICTNLVAL